VDASTSYPAAYAAAVHVAVILLTFIALIAGLPGPDPVVIVKLNDVLFVRVGDVPVTVTVETPSGVPGLEAARVKVVAHVGLQEPGEKVPVLPAGRPEAANTTVSVEPATHAAVIVAVDTLPTTAEMFPLWVRLKLKAGMASTVKLNVDTEGVVEALKS